MTDCSVKYSRRTHIIPVFATDINTDKAWNFPDEMDADTVYLITTRINPIPLNIEKIRSRITETRNVDIKLIRGVFEDDLYYAIGVLRKIIESERGNYIFINCPSKSHIWTSAGLIAAMLFQDDKDNTKIIPYYLKSKPRLYTGKIRRQVGFDIKTLSLDFRIEKPQDEILRALKSIADLENMGIGVTKTVLIESLIHLGFDIPAENPPTPGIHNAIQRKYLNPLLENGYITASGHKKRAEYSVTEKGKNALHAFVE